MAFLVGSPKHERFGPAIDIFKIFEYLTYDTENQKISICGDFLVRNRSGKPRQLYMLHRGNIDFQATTNNWMDDNRYTKVLREIAASEAGLGIKDGRLSYWNHQYSSLLEAELLPDPEVLEEWGPQRPKDGSYVFFTVIKSPELEPEKSYIFRIIGTLQGGSYRQVKPTPTRDPTDLIGSLAREGVVITGGERALHEEMEPESQMEARRKYRNCFQHFYNNLFVYPDYHNFFLEFADGSPLKVFWKSGDLTEARQNELIDKRRITWLWSDSDFNIYCNAYGPLIGIAKQPLKKEQPPKRDNRPILTGVL